MYVGDIVRRSTTRAKRPIFDNLNLALPASCVHVASRGCSLPVPCARAENGESHTAPCIKSVSKFAISPDLLERQCVAVLHENDELVSPWSGD